MRGAYLALLLAALAGVGLLDARLRLALWRRPRAALISVGAGVAMFLAWDAVALTAGFYSRGAGSELLRIDVLPRLPLEEVVFVTFLAYLAAVVFGLAERAVVRAAGGSRGSGGAGATRPAVPPPRAPADSPGGAQR